MDASILVPVSEYLEQTFHPDCDYVEGVLEERHVGEISHSDAQSALNTYARIQVRGFWSGVGVRVQVNAERFRVPDVVIVRGGRPAGRIITSPPEVVVEVLSPEDRFSNVVERINDYLAFGIPCVWVIDPENRHAWIYTVDGSREVKDGMLRNPLGDVVVPLSAVFAA